MKALTLLGAGVLSLTLVACNNNSNNSGSSGAPAESTAPPATEANVVRIATESNFKPFSYLDNQGNLVGFEIDLANAMCQQMQATCEITSHDWDGLIPSLNANRFDAIMAGMSITDERKQVVDFSEPYFNNTLVLVAKKDKPVTIVDVNGKNVAVQQATVSAQYLANNYPAAIVKAYDKQDNAYLDLVAERVDFMLSDIVPMLDWLQTENGSSFEVKGDEIDIDDKVAIAVRKGDAETLNKFNTALQALKANGEYDKIVAKYFDTTVLKSDSKQNNQTTGSANAAVEVVTNAQAADASKADADGSQTQ